MCTLEKRGNLFILTLTGNDEHRLNPTLISSILSALSQAKDQSSPGCALVTLAQGKFFSNGVDFGWAQAQSAGTRKGTLERVSHLLELFKPVVAAFINLPMPTVAAVTGHAVGAGFVMALSHDYVFMRRDRGVLYMSTVDMGLTVPDYFEPFLRDKVVSASTRRDVFLLGRKVKGDEAEKMGIVEAAYEGEEKVREASLRVAEELAKRKWDGEVYAEIRKGLYPLICAKLGLPTKAVASARL